MCLKFILIILFTNKIKEELFIYALVLLWFWATESVRKRWFLNVQGTFSWKGTVMDSRLPGIIQKKYLGFGKQEKIIIIVIFFKRVDFILKSLENNQ